jgi:hypothetical protein
MGTKSTPKEVPTQPTGITAEAAVIAANAHLLLNYVIGLLGGTPYHLSLPESELWIVPMILTSPGYGAVGEVGAIAVDARTAQVVGGTPREEVMAAIRRLREAKHDELEAAFLQARKG